MTIARPVYETCVDIKIAITVENQLSSNTLKNTLTNATIIALHDFYYLYVLKQYILLENLTSKKEYSSPESRVLFQLLNKILS